MFSMAEKLVKSYRLSHKLSQSSIDALFPSSITLLPPDISRQIELDSQKAPAAGDDKYAVLCLGKRHTFNGPFSGTTQVSRYQKAKTNLDFTEARDSEWQWHQLCHMQVCTSLQTENHRSVFYRPDAIPAAQPTASKL